MNIKRLTTRRVYSVVSSDRFFWGVVVLLALQALWIALSGRYPMAFDEDFHLGVIKLYAHHLSPFWNGHPADGDAFGAVARDPSYLYHYLMSFPYRLVSAITSSQMTQVLGLRFINIGLFAAGLPLYRRLLSRVGASRSLVNLSLLVFVLVPITPFLAAQINYDNLLLPLVALSLLLALKLRDGLRKNSKDVKTGLLLLIVCLAASLVKYAFLPIFVAIVGFALVVTWRRYGSVKRFVQAFTAGWKAMGRWTTIGLILALVLVGSLFVERYGVNLFRYHKPVVDCGEVLDYEHCQYYGPWIRDYNFEANKGADSDRGALSFTQHWFYGLWFRSFFAVDGPATAFQTRGPLIVPGVSVIVLASLGAAAFLVTAGRLWKRYNAPALWLLTAVSLSYLFVLWLQQYQLFVQTGQPVAINGRYLLPMLPWVILIAALAVKELLGAREKTKMAIGALVLICFLWGGGALTYILRSNNAWYWPNSLVKALNHDIQKTLGPVTPGYHKPTQFLH